MKLVRNKIRKPTESVVEELTLHFFLPQIELAKSPLGLVARILNFVPELRKSLTISLSDNYSC